jgi:cullin-associated NEDD8-dissociated protein 1
VGDARVEELCDGLLAKLLSSKPKEAAAREVGALGLRTLIAAAQPGAAASAALARRVSPRLAEAVAVCATAPAPEVQSDALDICHDLLVRFGGLAAPEHEALRVALLAQLEGPRPALRKRAIAGLGALAAALPDAALLATCDAVLAGLASSSAPSGDLLRARVHAAGALLRAAGPRLGGRLGALLPAVTARAAAAPEGDAELRELALAALEAALARAAPADVAPHREAITSAALTFLRYDPNFAGEEEDEGAEGGGEEEMADAGDGDDDEGGGDDDDDDGGAYSDDEDVSWKVRRAAARLCGALVTSAASARDDGGALAALYGRVAPALVSRFREREESVRTDVLGVAEALVRATGAAAAREGAEGGAAAAALDALLPALVRAAAAQLGASAPPRTRSAAFALLRELAAARPGRLEAHLGALVAPLARALTEKGGAAAASGGALKADALSCARALLATHRPAAFRPHLRALIPALCASAGERYYKVSAQALRALADAVPALAPTPADAAAADAAPLAAQTYAALASKLSAPDADQEVKEAALAAMGCLLAAAAGVPGCDAAAGAAALLERARGDATRLAAVKALHALAASPLPALAPALAPLAAPLAAELTSYLRKASRPLRAASLAALTALLERHAGALPPGAVEGACAEAAALVGDADLALCSAALALCTRALSRAPAAAAPACAAKALPPALALLPSPLVQGAALAALRRFFCALATPAAAAAGAPPFPKLLQALLDAGKAATAPGAGKHAAAAVAACVGAACAGAGGSAAADTAARLLDTLRAPGGAAAAGPVPLLCLGDIGRRTDLSAMSPNVADTLMAAFDAPGAGEDIKDAAAAALGGVATGNTGVYLPLIAVQLREPKAQYALLRALRVALTPRGERDSAGAGAALAAAASAGEDASGAADASAPPVAAALSGAAMEAVLATLFAHADAEDEAARAAVSECLGCAVVTHPSAAVPALRARLGAPSPLLRAVALHGARCALMERPSAAAAALSSQPGVLDELLAALRDGEHGVRHAAVQLLSAAAHYAPPLVRPRLGGALPALLDTTAPRPELVRTVDLGPFKHIVDDGLELRKASFECLGVLLDDGCAAEAEPKDGIAAAVAAGAGDHYDVKMGAHAVCVKLAAVAPGAALGALDALAAALEKTLQVKLKADAVKQESDRHEDMLRSALRAVDALARTPGADANARFATLMAKTVQMPPLAPKYAAIAAEHAAAAGAAGAADAMDTA